MIDQARLKELLHYDPETGIFTSRVNRGCWTPGKRVGGKRKDGYRTIRIDYKDYKEHRLAWLYAYGRWPENDLDHVLGDEADNRIERLREALRVQNNANSKRSKNNRSGFKGVTLAPRCNDRWRARIAKGGQQISLGTFGSPEEAHIAYCEAALRLFGEFARPD